jgi:hypothetical protein
MGNVHKRVKELIRKNWNVECDVTLMRRLTLMRKEKEMWEMTWEKSNVWCNIEKERKCVELWLNISNWEWAIEHNKKGDYWILKQKQMC